MISQHHQWPPPPPNAHRDHGIVGPLRAAARALTDSTSGKLRACKPTPEHTQKSCFSCFGRYGRTEGARGGGWWKWTCRQKTSTTASGACSSTSPGMSVHTVPACGLLCPSVSPGPRMSELNYRRICRN